MDETTAVELTKINFILENLTTLILQQFGASASDVTRIADEMRRQATEVPGTTYGPGSLDKDRYLELLGQRLDIFWAGVRDRLAQGQGTGSR
jgi:hypothetical protein